jgi:peptidoglycan/xylan/chitin deacetylase (PgdA/CDA1 family)
MIRTLSTGELFVRLRALRRLSVWLGLSLVLLFGVQHIPGRGEPVNPALNPAPAPNASSAAEEARQIAEDALVAAAGQSAAMAEALARQVVRSGEGNDTPAAVGQRSEDQSKQVSSRGGAGVSAPTAPPQTGPVRVPIFMYHHIADAPPGADAIRKDLSVTPAAFTRQMEYLATHGYHTISLADLVERLQNGRPLPEHAVVLTFDDGYDDNYTQAYPILRSFGFTGTFFLITDAVGNREYMTWQQAIEMSRNNMAIEAHGRTHADLSASTLDDTVWQIGGSKTIIEEKLGQPVRFYCYPSGKYNAQTISVLRARGYLAGVTTSYGATHAAGGLFELTRVRMRGDDTLDQFINKLETAP